MYQLRVEFGKPRLARIIEDKYCVDHDADERDASGRLRKTLLSLTVFERSLKLWYAKKK